MSGRSLYNLGNELGLSKEQVIEGFDALKAKGVIFTPAKTAKEFFSQQSPHRVAFIGPTANLAKSIVSLGPFAVSQDFYVNTYLPLKYQMSQDELSVFLGFKRLEYEKIGAISTGKREPYKIQAPDEELFGFLGLMAFWDVMKPLVYEYFVWFTPTDECKRYAELASGQEFSPDDYDWWNIMIDIGEKFEPQIIEDRAEEFHYIPPMLYDWMKYLPIRVHLVLARLYMKATTGLQEPIKLAKNEIIEVIESVNEKYMTATADCDRSGRNDKVGSI